MNIVILTFTHWNKVDIGILTKTHEKECSNVFNIRIENLYFTTDKHNYVEQTSSERSHFGTPISCQTKVVPSKKRITTT